MVEAPKSKELIDLENVLDQLEQDLIEVNSTKDVLKKNFLELVEVRQVLLKVDVFLEEWDHEVLADVKEGQMGLGFWTGVIDRERVPAFELMFWRMCRGNVYLRTAEIENKIEDPETVSAVFIYKKYIELWIQFQISAKTIPYPYSDLIEPSDFMQSFSENRKNKMQVKEKNFIFEYFTLFSFFTLFDTINQ